MIIFLFCLHFWMLILSSHFGVPSLILSSFNFIVFFFATIYNVYVCVCVMVEDVDWLLWPKPLPSDFTSLTGIETSHYRSATTTNNHQNNNQQKTKPTIKIITSTSPLTATETTIMIINTQSYPDHADWRYYL